MVCSLIHFCFLRFVEPLCERGELAVALLGEVCDAGVFACGLILILGQSANDKFRYAAAAYQLWGYVHPASRLRKVPDCTHELVTLQLCLLCEHHA